MLLWALEVLFVEEVSLISAEQWSAMDIVLQELKQTTLPFNGVLVIASGDQMQLPSIEGNDIFLACFVDKFCVQLSGAFRSYD